MKYTLCFCVCFFQIPRTPSGRIHVCRVQPSQDLWVFNWCRQLLLLTIDLVLPHTVISLSVLLDNTHESVCHCSCHITCRHLPATLCEDIDIVHTQVYTVLFTIPQVDPYEACLSICSLFSSWLLCMFFVLCAGCPLLQRVQAEIWLLQEEIEETCKSWFFFFFKYTSVLCLWFLRGNFCVTAPGQSRIWWKPHSNCLHKRMNSFASSLTYWTFLTHLTWPNLICLFHVKC